jgi:signal transduction histidine kinase
VIYVVCADYTHQAELEKMSSESHKRLERIMSLVSDINILDIDKVLKKVAEYIRTIVPYDGMVIFAIDKERNVFVPRYCDDELRDAIMPLTFPLDRGVTGRVAHNGVPEIVNVTKLDKDALHVPGTPDSDERLLSFPLIGHEGTIGALNLYRSSEDFFLSDLRETSLISPHVAVALENALLYEKLSKEYDFINFLISLLSHDLKNPLMVSDGLLDILDHIGAAKAELPKLRWANQRMKNILERIQIFASLEYGLIEREYRNIEISSLIGEVREHFENHPKSASVTYCCEGGNASIYALGILPHIFINLIDNALKYCSACTVSCRLSGGMVTFCIADDGPGIPLEKRQVIFSKYARLDPDCAVSGSGIGLYVAHKLVELHHGTIAIEDNVPHGTVFLVSLPQDCRMKDVFGT